MPAVTTAAAAAAGLPLVLAAGASGWAGYTVREGDTVTDIARAHRTDVRTLVRANHLSDGGHLIRAGSTLLVPAKRTSASAAKTTAATAKAATTSKPAARTGRYRVRAGDTISDIALRLRVSPGTLLKLNHLDSRGRIYAGQHLTVPAAAARAQVKSARNTAAGVRTAAYTVRSGDTISSIAQRLGTTQAALLKANRLRATSLIFPGQHLSYAAKAARPRFSHNTFEGRTYTSGVVNAAAANRRALAGRSAPGREATCRIVTRAARRYGVDPALALAVAQQESGCSQRQVSVANAIGVMQVIPASGTWASELVGRHLDLLDTEDNVTAGVVILKSLTRSAKDRDHAVAGYYQGLASVQKRGMFADTKKYVRSVNALAARLA